jgi:hypothetical protein
MPGEDFDCLGNLKNIDESRLSFPSGHASLSFYSTTFLIVFINQSWNCRSLGLLPRIVQVLLFTLAVYIGLSRIVDNKHHPTDVIAGAILGASIAIITSFFLIKFLKKTNYKGRYYAVSTSSNEDLINNNNNNNNNHDAMVNNWIDLNETAANKSHKVKIGYGNLNSNDLNNNNSTIETIDGNLNLNYMKNGKHSRLIQNVGSSANKTVPANSSAKTNTSSVKQNENVSL